MISQNQYERTNKINQANETNKSNQANKVNKTNESSKSNMANEANKSNINNEDNKTKKTKKPKDDILGIVEKFVTYFENVDKGGQNDRSSENSKRIW